MAERIQVHGLRELQASIKRFESKVERRLLTRALMDAASIHVKEAKQRAPVDTGELARNIRARPDKPEGNEEAHVIVGVRKLTKKQLAKAREKREGASDPFYWRFVEFGTSKMRARPFLRPAFENTVSKMIARFTESLRDRLRKEGLE